jgi:hypothetical protein
VYEIEKVFMQSMYSPTGKYSDFKLITSLQREGALLLNAGGGGQPTLLPHNKY